MKEGEVRQRQLDIFDNTFLRTLEGADFIAGTIKETIVTVDKLQKFKKGGYDAKS